MSDFKTRIKTELKEIEEKQDKLLDFIESENFFKLDDVQQSLLIVQCSAMGTYRNCLEQRLRKL